MQRHWRIIGVASPLVLVEAASYWKLSHWLGWDNEPWLAGTTALAFIGLLLGSIVALSLDLPRPMRRHLYLGGLWLFLTQAVANVLIAYQYGLGHMPVELVTRFFGLDAESALKATALIQGASLSIVSISFWSVLAQLLRNHWRQQQDRQQQLAAVDRLLEEIETNGEVA
jgi:hypothetical protein